MLPPGMVPGKELAMEECNPGPAAGPGAAVAAASVVQRQLNEGLRVAGAAGVDGLAQADVAHDGVRPGAGAPDLKAATLPAALSGWRVGFHARCSQLGFDTRRSRKEIPRRVLTSYTHWVIESRP